jgi:hypothetical protein
MKKKPMAPIKQINNNGNPNINILFAKAKTASVVININTVRAKYPDLGWKVDSLIRVILGKIKVYWLSLTHYFDKIPKTIRPNYYIQGLVGFKYSIWKSWKRL